MTDKRVLLINEDGTAEVGGVEYVLVRKDIANTLLEADDSYPTLLSTPDLSALPRVPERKGDENWGDLATWNDALDAMGIKND